MHKIHFWVVRCLAVASFICTLPASAAYLQFTYTSQDLFFTSQKVEGVPTVVDGFVPPIPHFSISFTLPEKDLSLLPITSFFTRQLNLALDPYLSSHLNYPTLLSPSSYAQVNLDQMGQITSWNLVAFARELIPQGINDVSNEWVNIRSNNTTGDLITHQFNTETSRHGTPIQGARLEFNYAGETSPSNWTVTKIPVPEPGLAGLLLSGLGVLLWCRRQDKSTHSNEKTCLKSAN